MHRFFFKFYSNLSYLLTLFSMGGDINIPSIGFSPVSPTNFVCYDLKFGDYFGKASEVLCEKNQSHRPIASPLPKAFFRPGWLEKWPKLMKFCKNGNLFLEIAKSKFIFVIYGSKYISPPIFRSLAQK